MKIDDPDFGPLEFDEAIGAWTGRLRTAEFAHCAIKWHLAPAGSLREWTDDDDGAGSPDVVEIAVADGGDGTGPGAEQRAALAAFRADERRICAAVLAEVARVAREHYVTTDHFPSDAPPLTSQRDLAARLCSPDGVGDWLDRPRIDFHHTGEDGVSYTSFNSNAGFDIEHGIAVLMLRDQVREVGGCSEFYNF